MKIKVYPKGYDPMVASYAAKGQFSSPPSLKKCVCWTEEEGRKILLMEEQAEIVDVTYTPTDRWYEVID